VSEERRSGNEELVKSVTRLTTLFEENFDRDNGHVTVVLKDLKKKVDAHDTDLKWAKGAGAVMVAGGSLALAWLKAQIGMKH
jgi:hypothetical protein